MGEGVIITRSAPPRAARSTILISIVLSSKIQSENIYNLSINYNVNAEVVAGSNEKS
jgi:hypothetical protein